MATLARELAHALVTRGHGVVFGGGSVGLMGVLADAVLAAGGEVIGVMPKHMVDREVARGTGCTSSTRCTRKALMYDLSGA
jgi:predicted Rossmann-fold nucleotide-binding protein